MVVTMSVVVPMAMISALRTISWPSMRYLANGSNYCYCRYYGSHCQYHSYFRIHVSIHALKFEYNRVKDIPDDKFLALLSRMDKEDMIGGCNQRYSHL